MYSRSKKSGRYKKAVKSYNWKVPYRKWSTIVKIVFGRGKIIQDLNLPSAFKKTSNLSTTKH